MKTDVKDQKNNIKLMKFRNLLTLKCSLEKDLINRIPESHPTAWVFKYFYFKNCGPRPIGPKYPFPPLDGNREPGNGVQCDIIKNATYIEVWFTKIIINSA